MGGVLKLKKKRKMREKHGAESALLQSGRTARPDRGAPVSLSAWAAAPHAWLFEMEMILIQGKRLGLALGEEGSVGSII